jgi:hypothetical protein
MHNLQRLQRGLYTIKEFPGSLIWQEGEGPDAGKWFFDLGVGTGDVSEPYKTLMAAARAIYQDLT